MRSSVEVISSLDSGQCKAGDLPGIYMGHTSTGRLICGGDLTLSTLRSCVTLINGSWVTTHHLLEKRSYHMSWVRPDGRVMLLGGWISRNTTEILSDAGDSQPGFTLRYQTRDACLIDEGETVLITGGYSTMTTVSRYDVTGWKHDTEELGTGRYFHGCARYHDISWGGMVRREI